MSDIYKIVRYTFQKPSQIVKRGLTLEQAQEHCNDPSTASDGWFDGYEMENRRPLKMSILKSCLDYNLKEKRRY